MPLQVAKNKKRPTQQRNNNKQQCLHQHLLPGELTVSLLHGLRHLRTSLRHHLDRCSLLQSTQVRLKSGRRIMQHFTVCCIWLQVEQHVACYARTRPRRIAEPTAGEHGLPYRASTRTCHPIEDKRLWPDLQTPVWKKAPTRTSSSVKLTSSAMS